MPSGSADVTPGTRAQPSHCSGVTRESAKDGCRPSAGAENTRRSAGRPVIAETFCRPRPAVRPDSRPTSTVIRTMTVPIRANRPRANRRSLQATNTTFPSIGRAGRTRRRPVFRRCSDTANLTRRTCARASRRGLGPPHRRASPQVNLSIDARTPPRRLPWSDGDRPFTHPRRPRAADLPAPARRRPAVARRDPGRRRARGPPGGRECRRRADGRGLCGRAAAAPGAPLADQSRALAGRPDGGLAAPAGADRGRGLARLPALLPPPAPARAARRADRRRPHHGDGRHRFRLAPARVQRGGGDRPRPRRGRRHRHRAGLPGPVPGE